MSEHETPTSRASKELCASVKRDLAPKPEVLGAASTPAIGVALSNVVQYPSAELSAALAGLIVSTVDCERVRIRECLAHMAKENGVAVDAIRVELAIRLF